MNKKKITAKFFAVLLMFSLMLAFATTAYAADNSGSVQQRLAVGEYYTMVVKDDGSLWFWGEGNPNNLTVKDDGSLGYDENPTSLSIPVNSTKPIKLMDNVVYVCASMGSAAAIKADGSLWWWHGEKEPDKVLDNVVQVDCSVSHYAAVQKDGTLWTWGDNSCGQLGDGTITTSTKPVKVMKDVAYVSCGVSFTAAIKKDGSLWTWGKNSDGQLGNGGVGNENLFTSDRWTELEEALQNSGAISGGGAVGGVAGSINISERKYLTTPSKVMDNVTSVSCGMDAMAAVKADGSLWLWGNNNIGQLGIGKVSAPSTVPVKVFDYGVSKVSIGNSTVAIIKTDNSLWTWGNGAYGILGIGINKASATAPVKVMNDVVAVRTGDNHAAAIKKDGSVWLWGNNQNGHLGFNDYNVMDDGFFNEPLPCQTLPMMLKDFSIKTAGGQQTPAAKEDDLSGVSAWAKEEVSAAIAAGLVPELTGNPGYRDAITREQFAELVVRLVSTACGKAPELNSDLNFTDCYNSDVLLAASAGIVDGVGNGKFAPTNTTNREQIAAMVFRAIKYINAETGKNPAPKAASLSGFADKNSVSGWATEGMGTLVANGIMQGSGGKLAPKDSCTVEQSILLIYRLYEIIAGN